MQSCSCLNCQTYFCAGAFQGSSVVLHPFSRVIHPLIWGDCCSCTEFPQVGNGWCGHQIACLGILWTSYTYHIFELSSVFSPSVSCFSPEAHTHPVTHSSLLVLVVLVGITFYPAPKSEFASPLCKRCSPHIPNQLLRSFILLSEYLSEQAFPLYLHELSFNSDS